MNEKVALFNFELLNELPENTKLIVNKNENENKNKLNLEYRWFQGFRRYIFNDSRYDILDPIKLTFKCIKKNNIKNEDEIRLCLEHIKPIFSKLYPDYNDLNDFIESKLNKTDIDKKQKVSKEYRIDLTKIINRTPDAFISIIPKNIDWENIKTKHFGKEFSYSYISPNKNKPDRIYINMGSNICLNNTTGELGNIKYMDFTNCLENLNDGKYKIQYNKINEKDNSSSRYDLTHLTIQNGDIIYG